MIVIIQSLEDFSGESLIAYYEAMIARPARTDLLKNTKVPVFFIAGTHDIAAPLGDVLKQCHLPIRSYFHVLQPSGHMGMIEEPGKSNQALEEFLSSPFFQ
jgi:pimeloyl-ACP methyl ester carboxylesterase